MADLPCANTARRSEFLQERRERKQRRETIGRSNRVVQVESAIIIQNNFRIKYNGWRLQRILEEQHEAERREAERVEKARRLEELKKEREAWLIRVQQLPASSIRDLLLSIGPHDTYSISLSAGWSNLFDHVVGAMNFYPNVAILSLRLCAINTPRAMATFCKSVRVQECLTELMLCSCNLNSAQVRDILRALRKTCAPLKVIDLTNNRVSRGARKGIDMYGHRVYEVSKEGMEELGLCLKRFNTLRTLTLHKAQVLGAGMEGMIANRAFFSKRTVLRNLDISDNAIGIKGAQALAHVIAGCPGLSTINLAGNRLHNLGLDYILLSLIRHPSFLSIDLSRNHITDSGVERIVELVKHTPLVTGLDLQRNAISAKGIAKLATGILFHDSVQDLNLSFNNLGTDKQDEDIAKIQALLSSSRSLKHFGFRSMNLVARNVSLETTNIHAAARIALSQLNMLLDGICASRYIETADFRDHNICRYHDAHIMVQQALSRRRAILIDKPVQREIAAVVTERCAQVDQEAAARIFLRICTFAARRRMIRI